MMETHRKHIRAATVALTLLSGFGGAASAAPIGYTLYPGSSTKGSVTVDGISLGAFKSTATTLDFQGSTFTGDYASMFEIGSDLLGFLFSYNGDGSNLPNVGASQLDLLSSNTLQITNSGAGVGSSPFVLRTFVPDAGNLQLVDLPGTGGFSFTITGSPEQIQLNGGMLDVNPFNGDVLQISISAVIWPAFESYQVSIRDKGPTSTFQLAEKGVATVPEPASMALFVAGACGLAWRRHRRKRAGIVSVA